MPKIQDWVTHISNPEDVPFLKVPLFKVNMRLFRDNSAYRELILQIVFHISHVALTKMDGYKQPHGCSGANCAIPFDIIVLVQHRGTPEATGLVMINPKILSYSRKTVVAESNCGSIRHEKPIPVLRSESVRVSWYDLDGLPQEQTFTPLTGSFTIQHEIDHNLGILITDRAI